jgi:hypothetical protein
MNRKMTAMAQTTVTADFGKPFDIHAYLTTQVTLNRVPIHSLS